MVALQYSVSPAGLTEEELKKEFATLLPSAMLRTGRNAANRTATSLRTKASQLAREDLALRAKDAKDALTIKRAARGAEPSAAVSIEPKPISLKRYSARTTRKGVTLKVRKSEGRKVLQRGFITSTLGGHPFIREKDAPRFPIRKGWGPSVRVELEQHRDELDKHRKETFEKRFREQANWEIEKMWRRR